MSIGTQAQASLTFVVLVPGAPGDDVAQILGERLARDDETDRPGIVLLPEVRGSTYLTARGESGAELDDDWAAEVDSANTEPVFILQYEEGLEQLIGGLDASFVIGAPNREVQVRLEETVGRGHEMDVILATNPYLITEFALGRYGQRAGRSTFRPDDGEEWTEATPTVSGDQLADEISRQISGRQGPQGIVMPPPEPAALLDDEPIPQWPSPGNIPPPPGRVTPNPAASTVTSAPTAAVPPAYIQALTGDAKDMALQDWRRHGVGQIEVQRPATELPPLVGPKDSLLGYLSRAEMPPAPDWAAEPERKVEPPPAGGTKIVPPTKAPAVGPADVPLIANLRKSVLARLGGPSNEPFKVKTELADRVMLLRGLKVAVGIGKGGTGKTATSTGLAVMLGAAAAMRGQSAILVDANVGNPSSWGSLGIRQDLCTVEAAVQALMRDEAPTLPPAGANTPGLAVYRETAGGGQSYTAGELRRFTDFAMTNNGVLVADLHNSLPDPSEKAGQVVGYWLSLADVVVMPIDPDPSTFIDAHIYLDHLERLSAERGQPIPVVVAYLAAKDRVVRSEATLREDLDRLKERVQDVVFVPRDERYYLALRMNKSIAEVSRGLTRAYSELADKVVEVALLARSMNQ